MRTVLAVLAIACIVGYTNALFGLTSRRFYVGGAFSKVTNQSTQASVGYVATFAYGIWSPLNSGADGEVKVVHVDSLYNVYIGGVFSNAGGVSTGPAAVFKRGATNWAPIGGAAITYDGTAPVVSSRGVYTIRTDCATANTNGCDVFIGGYFQFAASDGNAVNIAKYDSASSKWLALGSTGSCPSGTSTTITNQCDGHGLVYSTTGFDNNVVYGLWKKEASCSASSLGLTSAAGVACNLWIVGKFSQIVKFYNSKTSKWNSPNNNQAVKDGSSSLAGNYYAKSVFYQSYLLANDEVYIGGYFDFKDDSSAGTRAMYVAKIQVTNPNKPDQATMTFTALSTAGAVPSGVVNSVSTSYNSYQDYALSQSPKTIVIVGGVFTSTSTTSNVLLLDQSASTPTWASISSTDVSDIGTNMTQVNSVWSCGKASLDCKAQSVLVGGSNGVAGVNNVGYTRYFNKDDGTWNTLGGSMAGGAVNSVDSAVSAGSTKSMSYGCMVVVFLAMLFVTMF